MIKVNYSRLESADIDQYAFVSGEFWHEFNVRSFYNSLPLSRIYHRNKVKRIKLILNKFYD